MNHNIRRMEWYRQEDVKQELKHTIVHVCKDPSAQKMVRYMLSVVR